MIAFNRSAADRYAAQYRENPTPGRANNAAQQLAPALAEIDRLLLELADRNIGNPGRYYLTEQGVAASEPDVPMPTRRSSALRGREAS